MQNATSRITMPTVMTPLKADKAKQNVPSVDCCWHVALITFLILLVTTFLLKNSGFILVGMMNEFGADREQASWPTSVRVASNLASVLLVGLLLRWFRAYRVALVGSVFLWAGMMAAAFATNVVWMTFAFGLHGVGMGAMYVTISVAIFKYFDKYKGFANGLARAGETAAGIVSPFVLVFLQESYSFRGALFIYGALALHATVLCLLLKDPPWMAPKKTKIIDHKPEALTGDPKNDVNNINESAGSRSVKHSDSPYSVGYFLTMFRNPMFCVFVVFSMVVYFSQNAFFTTIVDFAMDRGSSLAEASSIVTYISPVDFVGRMILPLLADRNYIRRSTLVMVLFCVMAVSMISLPHTASFATLLAICVCFGTCLGSLLTMEVVIVTDYIGFQLFAVCYGFCCLASIPGVLASPLLFGFFRDSMGTYDNMYRLIGGIHLAMSLLFGIVAWRERQSVRSDQA